MAPRRTRWISPQATCKSPEVFSARILAETSLTETVLYLYGDDCLGEVRDAEPLYYLHDAAGSFAAGGYVRQGVDADGAIVSAWLFDPDGTMLEGPDGPVSHLICGGVYDGSTGLIYRDGGYFDPRLGIWLMLAPLMMVQSWWRRKDKRSWVLLLCAGLFAVGGLAGCGKEQVGMVCIDENIPQSQWKLVPDYLRYDYERDYTSNLISAFGELHTDLSEVNWAGISSDFSTLQNFCSMKFQSKNADFFVKMTAKRSFWHFKITNWGCL